MKKSHAGFWAGLTMLFLAAIYSAAVFLLKPAMDVSAWMLYGFTIAAFLLMGSQLIAVARKNAQIVLDSALGLATAVYFALQFLFGGVICMCFEGLPTTPVLICEALLLAGYLVAAFVMFGAQSHSAAQDRNEQAAVRKMRLLEAHMKTLAEEQQDAQVKKALLALAEDIHFSDVAVMQGLEEVEGRMMQNVAALQDDLMDEEADVFARIETIRRLLKERDRTAAILKRE